MTETAGAFVVVGAGQAGAWVARTLRAEGFAGRVVLIGREAHQPYERPPLSKAVLSGAATPDSAVLLTAAQAEGLAIECWLSTEVAALDRAGRRVICADGRALRYDRLFLTTGGRARTLPAWEAATHPRIHLLRTLDDAAGLRAALTDGATADASRTLLVLGGGWIGLEVAATARRLGVAVTVVEAAPRLCARALPPVASDYLRHLHESHGVTIRLGCAVAALDGTAAGVAMALADGTVLVADHAVIGIGMRPDTGLAAAAGLAVADGIAVDAAGRTSDPLIYAAGDAASHPSAFAGTSLRLESWANAQNQAIVAAKAALGHDVRYAEVPWFWSDQYDVNLQILGLPERGVRAVARGAPQAGSGAWLMLGADGRAAGVIAVNAPRDLRGVRRMIADGLTPDPAAWADAATPLNRIGSLPPAT
jgi:3-phenylpropionate/trans-cinnamate dioxygenase ferredoxin reductase subunit